MQTQLPPEVWSMIIRHRSQLMGPVPCVDYTTMQRSRNNGPYNHYIKVVQFLDHMCYDCSYIKGNTKTRVRGQDTFVFFQDGDDYMAIQYHQDRYCLPKNMKPPYILSEIISSEPSPIWDYCKDEYGLVPRGALFKYSSNCKVKTTFGQRKFCFCDTRCE